MHTATRSPIRFALGKLLMTANAQHHLDHQALPPQQLIHQWLNRHQHGDWGNLCAEDAALNNDALTYGGRLFSVYDLPEQSIWIITEADRSATTILLPED